MKSIMNYNAMVMVSKWNKDSSLIASGGQAKTVQVWQPNSVHKADQQVIRVFNQENDVVDLDW